MCVGGQWPPLGSQAQSQRSLASWSFTGYILVPLGTGFCSTLTLLPRSALTAPPPPPYCIFPQPGLWVPRWGSGDPCPLPPEMPPHFWQAPHSMMPLASWTAVWCTNTGYAVSQGCSTSCFLCLWAAGTWRGCGLERALAAPAGTGINIPGSVVPMSAGHKTQDVLGVGGGGRAAVCDPHARVTLGKPPLPSLSAVTSWSEKRAEGLGLQALHPLTPSLRGPSHQVLCRHTSWTGLGLLPVLGHLAGQGPSTQPPKLCGHLSWLRNNSASTGQRPWRPPWQTVSTPGEKSCSCAQATRPLGYTSLSSRTRSGLHAQPSGMRLSIGRGLWTKQDRDTGHLWSQGFRREGTIRLGALLGQHQARPGLPTVLLTVMEDGLGCPGHTAPHGSW